MHMKVRMFDSSRSSIVHLGLLVMIASVLVACGRPKPGRVSSDVDSGGAIDTEPSDTQATRPRGSGESESRQVDSSGGKVSVNEMELEIPEGALEKSEEVTVTETTKLPPDELRNVSPVYEYGPEGTTFRKPVTVRLPFEGPAEGLTVYWTRRGGSEYAPLGGRILKDQGVIEVEVTHFSSGTVVRQGSCSSDLDCQAGPCVNGICDAPDCDDNLKNANETDVDCGGPTCVRCTAGKSCAADADCYGTCTSGTCQATCSDGRTNADETDVDCGGPACSPCTLDKRCLQDSDCNSGLCEATGQNMVMACARQTSCSDGMQNYQETDVDCGGPNCPKCSDGDGCQADVDCQSGNCDNGSCQQPQTTLQSCPDVVGCVSQCGSDNNCINNCRSMADAGALQDYDGWKMCGSTNNCSQASCYCQNCGQLSQICIPSQCSTANCSDGTKNNQETDIDCGGPNCAKCADGKSCGADSDCQSGDCANGTCQQQQQMNLQSCSDIINCVDQCGQDTHCINSCILNAQQVAKQNYNGWTTCGSNNNCSQASCYCQNCPQLSQACIPSQCSAATCSDGMKNYRETDVDCGGSVCPGCANHESCGSGSDCQSGKCVNGTCQAQNCQPTQEMCDGKDNDCDGAVDENCACNYSGKSKGVCANGTLDLHGTCTKPTAYESSETSCDGKDNDCDGSLDEASGCPTTWLVGGSGFQFLDGIASDKNGSLYIVGTTTASLANQTYSGGFDAFIAKYDTSGNRQWLRIIGTADDERGYGIKVGTSGGIYVVGKTSGALGGTGQGGDDAFLAKYDAQGGQSWLKTFGGGSDDVANALSVGPNGSIYVAGKAGGAISGKQTNGGTDGFLAKYTTTGSRSWLTMLGSSADDEALDVDAGSTGVYVSGWAKGVFGNTSHTGGKDGFLARFDTAGSRQWARLLGTGSDETAAAVWADHSQSRIYIGGTTGGNLAGGTNAGGTDGYAAHFDAQGNRTWVTMTGSPKEDEFVAGILSSKGGIHFIGSTRDGWGDSSIDATPNCFRATFGWFGSDMLQFAFGSTGTEQLSDMVEDANGTRWMVGSGDTQIRGKATGAKTDGFVTSIK